MSYRIKTVSKTTLVDDAHLLSGMERLWLKAEEHRRAVLGGSILAVASVVAVFAVFYFDHLQAEKAMDLHRQAVRFYVDRPVGQPSKADENLKKAIGLYRQVVEQYPNTPTGQLATYELSNALVQANDIGGAIEGYRKHLATYQTNQTLRGLVHQRLAFAYLLNGDREQAAKQFTAVLDMSAAVNKDLALFELGKLEETQSRREDALTRYQDLTKAYPRSPFAPEAEIRIRALGGKKVETPIADPPGKPEGK